MRRLLLELLIPIVLASPAYAQASADTAMRPKQVHHYVWFGGDREGIKTAKSFLDNKNIEGAQILYPWRRLERNKDEYDFSPIREDLEFLKAHGKRLWIQLQEVSFSETRKNVPDYLMNDTIYHGGVAPQYTLPGQDEAKARITGWVARRWDPAVRDRFHKLLLALGKEFDGQIEGINLPETAIVFGSSGKLFPSGFTHQSYREAIVINMQALKRAFPKSVAMQYANFIPGEWRPTEDKGYLRGVYTAAKGAGVAVGGPDLMPFRPGQVGSSYPLIHEFANSIPAGIAVQDGNFAEINPNTNKPVTFDDLLDYATKYLKVDYIFWGTEEPYYSRDVIPALSRLTRK